MAVVRFERLSYWYPASVTPALRELQGELDPGLTLVAGTSGSGKSSLLRVLDGLVPHFHGGRVAGRAVVAGHDVVATPTRTLARDVGFVFQDPERSFVYGTVEREVAFALENTGVPAGAMHRRVDEALERLGIGILRQRRIATLSGGERQRVALAAALVLRPSVLALDEPTAQLDPAGAAAVIQACVELAAGGLTVVVAEHRLERLLPCADRVIVMQQGRASAPAAPAACAARLPSPPQIVELGLACGWSPLPLTVAEARPLAPQLEAPAATRHEAGGPVAWAFHDAAAGPAGAAVVEHAELAGRHGEVVVLMGPNGHGKTTLLRTLAGLLPPLGGRVERAPGRVAYVPQDPAALLHRASLAAEVAHTLRRTGSAEPAGRALDELGLGPLAARDPRDLSGGERQRGAIAAALAGSPDLALLDEPTRGMDHAARDATAARIGRLRGQGAAVVLATHDSLLAAAVGDRIVEVRDGRLAELGAPEQALSGTQPYATQVGQLYRGGPVTVAQVVARR